MLRLLLIYFTHSSFISQILKKIWYFENFVYSRRRSGSKLKTANANASITISTIIIMIIIIIIILII